MTQEEVLENFFNSKGYTNNLQAEFFLKLANAIQEKSQSKNLKKTFPKPRTFPKDESKGYDEAFSLVQNYLDQNKMAKTKQYLTSNSNGAKISSVEDLTENLSLEETKDPLKQLVKDHKARQLLNPNSVNVRLNQEYLD